MLSGYHHLFQSHSSFHHFHCCFKCKARLLSHQETTRFASISEVLIFIFQLEASSKNWMNSEHAKVNCRVIRNLVRNFSGNWELARSEFENLAQIIHPQIIICGQNFQITISPATNFCLIPRHGAIWTNLEKIVLRQRPKGSPSSPTWFKPPYMYLPWWWFDQCSFLTFSSW